MSNKNNHSMSVTECMIEEASLVATTTVLGVVVGAGGGVVAASTFGLPVVPSVAVGGVVGGSVGFATGTVIACSIHDAGSYACAYTDSAIAESRKPKQKKNIILDKMLEEFKEMSKEEKDRFSQEFIKAA